MKRVLTVILFLFSICFLYAKNPVEYENKWDFRNMLIYEKGDELWDVYVQDYIGDKGCLYLVEMFYKTKEVSDRKAAFEGYYIHDEYCLNFDSYSKTVDFMNALTKEFLKDNSIIETSKYLNFVSENFGYVFDEDHEYFDYESRKKRYSIKLLSSDKYDVKINVYKSIRGNYERIEYSFIYQDKTDCINFIIEDFDAPGFFLLFTDFYDADYDMEKKDNLHAYFYTLYGKYVESEGMYGEFTITNYDLNLLYKAFCTDLLYSTVETITKIVVENINVD